MRASSGPVSGPAAICARRRITVPQHILEARLVTRERPSDGDLAGRIARFKETGRPDFVIRNFARPTVGDRRLLNVIRDGGALLVF
jgi:ribose 1,5-bisphosphokinase PhnN